MSTIVTTTSTSIEEIKIGDTFEVWRNKINSIISKVNSSEKATRDIGGLWLSIDGVPPLGGLPFDGRTISANIGDYKELWVYLKGQITRNHSNFKLLTGDEWEEMYNTYGTVPYYACLNSDDYYDSDDKKSKIVSMTKAYADTSLTLEIRLPHVKIYNFNDIAGSETNPAIIPGSGVSGNPLNSMIGVYATSKDI